MTDRLWLQGVLLFPLGAAFLCLVVSSRLGAALSRAASLAAFLFCIPLWWSTDPSILLAPPLTEGIWLPGIGVDFTLAITGFSLPFLAVAQLVCLAALCQQRIPSRIVSPALLFAQFATTVAFTAQDFILFSAALQAAWLGVFLSAQVDDSKAATKALAVCLVAGNCLLGVGAVLGSLHLQQFQTFSARLPALRELSMGASPVVGDLSLPQVLFALLAMASFCLAPIPPAHFWLRPLLQGKGHGPKVFVVGLGAALAVFTWLQWIIPVFPDVYAAFSPYLLFGLSLSCVYAAALAVLSTGFGGWLMAVTLAQTSAALLGLGAASPEGASGAVLHALAWAPLGVALAWLLNWFDRRFGSDSPHEIGSLAPLAPRAAILVTVLLALVCMLPGSGGFASSLLLLSGLLHTHPLAGGALALAWALVVASAFRVGQPLLTGPSPHLGFRPVVDVKGLALAGAILAAVCISIGCHPEWVRSKTDPALRSYWKVPLKALQAARHGRST